jgi:large subunit ribosomal protein L25
MSNDFELNAEVREDKGKGASRRLRRLADSVPAIIYGGDKEPQPITLKHNEFNKALENEAFYSHVISLNVAGDKVEVLLKDLQRHPSRALIMHADFLRIDKNKKVQVKVPLHFINEATSVGVKISGGMIIHNMTELDISCLPANLPEFIEVDMQEVDIGSIVHISDLKLPEGVESVALSHGDDHDLPVAAVNAPKAVTEEEQAAPAEEPAEDDNAAEEGGEE